MNIKNLITVATTMMFAAGLLIWSKVGEIECIYAIDEKDKMYWGYSLIWWQIVLDMRRLRLLYRPIHTFIQIRIES